MVSKMFLHVFLEGHYSYNGVNGSNERRFLASPRYLVLSDEPFLDSSRLSWVLLVINSLRVNVVFHVIF